MNKQKKGFSLVEILLAMMIIAIVVTLGYQIGEKSLKDKYNLFIYTGYKGMTDALNEAEAQQDSSWVDTTSCKDQNGNFRMSGTTPIYKTNKACFIEYILSGNEDMNGIAEPTRKWCDINVPTLYFRTPNGIMYEIHTYKPANSDEITEIRMYTPAERTNNGVGYNSFNFRYNQNGALPLGYQGSNYNGNNSFDLRDRTDILPFIDDKDGLAGKTQKIYNSNGTFNTRHHPIDYSKIKGLRDAAGMTNPRLLNPRKIY